MVLAAEFRVAEVVLTSSKRIRWGGGGETREKGWDKFKRRLERSLSLA